MAGCNDNFKMTILLNAEVINRLKKRINETFADGKRRVEWKEACREFHAKYEELAFPGGERTAYKRILSGDYNAIEAGLAFIECRPYFFRSGYMFKDLLRKLKKAPLDDGQQQRLDIVIKKFKDYKAQRKAAPPH